MRGAGAAFFGVPSFGYSASRDGMKGCKFVEAKSSLPIDDASMVAHRSTNLMYFSPIRRYVDLRPVL
jgi:hypothetical protein